MTHTPGIGNFSAKTPKITNFQCCKLYCQIIKHIIFYLNLAVLLTCMVYYMRLRNVNYYQGYPLIFLMVHREYVEGTIFRGYMGPRKFRQLSILKAQSRLRFPINCLK